MYIALDGFGNRVHIGHVNNREKYFCPSCLKELVQKTAGNERAPHFAHKSGAINCKDSWIREKLYDISDWHRDWQNCFPVENQEITLTFGNVEHRADVLIDKTVIEFQHSSLNSENFNIKTLEFPFFLQSVKKGMNKALFFQEK